MPPAPRRGDRGEFARSAVAWPVWTSEAGNNIHAVCILSDENDQTNSAEPMTEVTAVDWLSQAFLSDPYLHYKALRESDPVHWDETRRSWLLTRYDHVAAALRDDDNLSAEQGPAFSMLVTDPPDHTRLRSLVSKAFTARTVQQVGGRIHQIVDELLDAVAPRGEMEVIA